MSYAVLEVAPDGTAVYIEKGTVTFDSYFEGRDWMSGLWRKHGPVQVVIESPASFMGMKAKFAHLIAMAMVEGAVASAVPADFLHWCPANGLGGRGGWRNHYFKLRKLPVGADWDRMVADEFAGGRVEGWPKTSNGHVRDAAMVGLVYALAVFQNELVELGVMARQFTAHKAVEANSAAVKRGEKPKKVRKPKTYTRRKK